MTWLERWLLLAIAGTAKATAVAVDLQITPAEISQTRKMQHRMRHPTIQARYEELGNELLTTFDGSNGSHGTMFDIRSTSSSEIQITGLDIHINLISISCSVTIYGRKGSHVEHETSQDGWDVIFDDNVTCAGFQRKTEVRFDEEGVVSLPPGETYAFFIYTPEPKLRYSDGDELNSVLAFDEHVEILEGTGLGGFFEDIYQPRIWNGVLHYVVTDNNEEEGAPDLFLQAEKQQPTCESFLTTADYFSSGAAGDYGTMFNIKTITPIRVIGFDVTTTPSAINAILKYEIFTKRHSFEQFGQDDIAAWHYVAAGNVQGFGPDRISTIPQSNFVPVSIPADTMQGFYITLHTPELLTHDTQLSTSGVFAATDELEIYAGVSVSDLSLGSYRSRRVFSGTVKYLRTDGNNCGVISTKPPTVSPTIGPTSPSTLRPSSAPLQLVPAESASLVLVSPKTDAPTNDPSWMVPTPMMGSNSDQSSTVSLTVTPTTPKPTVAPKPTAETIVSYTFLINYPSSWPTEVVENSIAKIVNEAIRYILLKKCHCLVYMGIICILNSWSLLFGSKMTVRCAKFGTSLVFYHSPALQSTEVTYTLLKYAHLLASRIDKDDGITVFDPDTEPLQTETIFTLSGVPSREMTDMEILYFQEIVMNFLDNAFYNNTETKSMDILSVKIVEQDLILAERSVRRIQESSSSIDIVTSITGQYLPPPEINFVTLVVDTIDDALSKGTGEPVSYFEKLEGIKVRPVKLEDAVIPPSTTTPAPTPKLTSLGEKPGIDFGGIVINPKALFDPRNPLLYAVIILILLIIMLLMVYLYWKQSKVIDQRCEEEAGGRKILRRPSMLTVPTTDVSRHTGSLHGSTHDLSLDFELSDPSFGVNANTSFPPKASSVLDLPTYEHGNNNLIHLVTPAKSSSLQHEGQTGRERA